MRGRALAPLTAAGIGLAGALAATLSLHRAAVVAVDHVLAERLTGAGQAAAALLAAGAPTPERLGEVMRANGLDGAYVLGPSLRVLGDAGGATGRRADLLRLDLTRVRAALRGEPSAAPGYRLGALTVMTGYFPIRGLDGAVTSALVLEAGQAFVAARAPVGGALALSVALSLLSGLGLAIAGARWSRAERERQEAAVRAARGSALSRVAAMAAHEIRNPLGVIRGTIDLMRERAAATLSERDRVALADIAGEVERLKRLTDDLVDLSADRPLARTVVSLGAVLSEAARTAEAAFPGISVRCDVADALPALELDAARMRQVFGNLLANAAQAQREGEIAVSARRDEHAVRIVFQDRGPGIPREIGERVFDLYFTAKSDGTGLGLAIARRLVERHGGTLIHLADRTPGAAFEVILPIATGAHPSVEGG